MTWFLDKEFLDGLDLSGYDPAAIAARTGTDVEVVRRFVARDRKYWVQSNPDYGWLAGANGDGKPTLLFVGQPRLSAEGSQEQLNAVCCDHQTGQVATHAIPVNGEVSWDTVLDAAAAVIGFEHIGNAPLLSFRHPTLWHYAIVPFPSHLHDDAVGRGEEDLSLVQDWLTSGSFVLHCGNAYYMDEEGEVTSS